MIHQPEPESPQPVAEAESLVGVAMHDLLAFFERWEAVRDENWGSGDYTKQSLGSRTDALLKEFRPLAEKIRQSALEEAWDYQDI
jgi:hypothetical protein